MSKRKKEKDIENIKAWRIIKKIFFAIFGKARWFLIGIAVSIIVPVIMVTCFDKSTVKSDEVTGEHLFLPEEYPVSNVIEAFVNDDGDAAVVFEKGVHTILSQMNLQTGETYNSVPAGFHEGTISYTPYGFCVDDENNFYGLCTVFDPDNQSLATREYVLKFGNNFDHPEKICTLEYDEESRVRGSTVYRLNYYDGKITFASAGREETYLYSIDLKTQNVSVSRPYKTDANGNFTTLVIPVDDQFLFRQTDGTYYLTGFDEPLTNDVYHVKTTVKDVNLDEFFDLAVMANGKLYVTRSSNNGTVYCLENGKLTEAFDLYDYIDAMEPAEDTEASEEYDEYGEADETVEYYPWIMALDTYKVGDKDELLIFTDQNTFVFDGEKLATKEVTATIRNHPFFVIGELMSILLLLSVLGLCVNIIIRRKTLLYKQIIVTLPILLFAAVLVSMNIYMFIQEQNIKRTEEEVELVCKVATSAFEGYDFSDFDEVNVNTGKAYRKLSDKLAEMDTVEGRYIFSIVVRYDEENAALLADSSDILTPYESGGIFRPVYEEVASSDGEELYLFKDVENIIGGDSTSSSIYAYGWIHDANDTGKYYLKIETESWTFFTSRRDALFKMLGYIAIIIASLTVVTVLSSLYITRTIKKATNTVGRIADGDFSARVKYKSKDELGEICSQVNTMANSLENMFDEKDKTEKFYYKFVPEKFRELLGKEEFTDLALGDAKSRDLTVLFFDIRAFSINSEIMTAKENFEFVNVVYGKAGPIVRKYNGFVDKYIGDAVMALFEDADDAVKCGIELYHEIVLNHKTAEEIGIGDINIGIGIHSGMARIGIVGEEERLSGTVISDTVNLSSRLESLTKQFKTAMLVSKDTVDRMSDPDSLKLRYLGEIQVAGVNEVKALYEVLDCLDDEEKEKRYANAHEFREAVRLFHLGRRADAVKALKELSDSGRDDYVTNKYLAYISGMSEEDKGNVFRFARK